RRSLHRLQPQSFFLSTHRRGTLGALQQKRERHVLSKNEGYREHEWRSLQFDPERKRVSHTKSLPFPGRLPQAHGLVILQEFQIALMPQQLHGAETGIRVRIRRGYRG